MIEHEQGRRRSIRTDRERLEMLKEEIAGLTPEAKRLLDATLSGMDDKDTCIMEAMADYRWIRKPVTVSQFLDDPYYMGESTKTLYPKIRSDLIDALGSHNYREMVLTGSIGYGKTTFLSLAIARMIYELSCLRSPQIAYGLSPGSELVIALISKSLHLSRTVMKTAVEDKLKLSPYFSDVLDPKYGRDVTKFPGNVMLTIGSCNSERVLGMNVIGGAMDEANFMAMKGQVISGGTGGGVKKTVAHFDMAEKVYASIVRRIKSRFLRSAADLPGMMVLASSAATFGSFTDRKLNEAESDPTVFVRDYATWDVKPANLFSGQTFKVVVGNNSLRSRILEPAEEDNWYEEQDCRVLDVPEEYREDFERDLENAIRDIAGISTHAISAFIHRVDRVEACIDDKLSHPFTVSEYVCGKPGRFMWEKLCRKKTRKLKGGFEETYYEPLRRPEKPRYVHIDTSLSGDSTGIAMGYVDKYVEVVRRNEDGEEYNDVAPSLVIEFLLRVNPPFGEQIFLPDVRRLVYELMEHGFHLCGFSCDQYQSAEMLQQIKAHGVRTKVLSVDRTTDPYEALKSAIYEDRIRYYRYEPFLKEVVSLEYDRLRGKVDHPVAGTKDVSDAVAGVVQGLIESARGVPAMLGSGKQASYEDDMSWVTGGKVQWEADKPAPTRQKYDGPLPIIMG